MRSVSSIYRHRRCVVNKRDIDCRYGRRCEVSKDDVSSRKVMRGQ